MEIHIKTISHNQQRYQTPGDWYVDQEGVLQIRVSGLGDERMEFLIADHELQEAVLCLTRGISEKHITEFDKSYERERAKGMHSADAEPGLDPRAPYRLEHQISNVIENIMMVELGVDPEEYADVVTGLLFKK